MSWHRYRGKTGVSGETAGLTGVLAVDKPAGKSSFAVVRAVRRQVGIKKVGHAGTLDPFATGLLVVCIGRPATKLISGLMEGSKTYQAALRLGVMSTTQDPEGELRSTGVKPDFTEAEIDRVLTRFTGEIQQIPPAFSALKYQGKPLYHYARRGITVEKEPRQVSVHELHWQDRRPRVSADDPQLSLLVRCSKGTYIRTLAEDIGAALGCGAYLTRLRRTESGSFEVARSLPGQWLFENDCLEEIRKHLLSVEEVRNLLQ